MFLIINAAAFGGAYAIANFIQRKVLDLYGSFSTLVHWIDSSLPADSGIPGALEASIFVPLFAFGLSKVPEIGYMAPVYPSISMIPGSVLLGVAAFGAQYGTPFYWPLFNTFGKDVAEFYKDFFAAFLPAVLALFI